MYIYMEICWLLLGDKFAVTTPRPEMRPRVNSERAVLHHIGKWGPELAGMFRALRGLLAPCWTGNHRSVDLHMCAGACVVGCTILGSGTFWMSLVSLVVSLGHPALIFVSETIMLCSPFLWDLATSRYEETLPSGFTEYILIQTSLHSDKLYF